MPKFQKNSSPQKKAYVDLRCHRQTLKVTVGKQFCYRFSLLFLQSFPRKKWHAVAASLGKRYRENLSIFRIRAALALPVEDFGVFALHLSPHVAERNQQHSNSLGAHFCLWTNKQTPFAHKSAGGASLKSIHWTHWVRKLSKVSLVRNSNLLRIRLTRGAHFALLYSLPFAISCGAFSWIPSRFERPVGLSIAPTWRL